MQQCSLQTQGFTLNNIACLAPPFQPEATSFFLEVSGSLATSTGNGARG